MKTLPFVLCLISAPVMAQQEITISGTLLGHDGKPMPKAHVHVLSSAQPGAFTSFVADDRGRYQVTTPSEGLVRLLYTGVNHEGYDLPLLGEHGNEFVIDIRLAVYPYLKEITSAQIIGDFNGFNFNTAQEMKKEPNGTFSAEFESDLSVFRYQILGVLNGQRSINGTQSDDFTYDGGGDYQSVVTPVKGKVRVVFDPAKVVRSDAPARASLRSKNPAAELLLTTNAENQRRQKSFRAALNAHRATGKDMKEFTYDWSGELNLLTKQIKSENDPLKRQYHLLSYMNIGTMARDGIDSSVTRQALREIPPDSWLWSLSPALILSAVMRSGESFDVDGFVAEFNEKNKDRNLKATILLNKMMSENFSGQSEKFRTTRRMLVEQYGDTPQGKMARDRFPDELRIAVGKQIPEFRIAAMEKEQVQYSNASLKGMLTLIDFWAVWCGPCIAEMETLHKAYERFKERKFQILSLSFDPKPEDVTVFRGKKWKMPWLHAFVEKGFNSQLAKDFEVMGIPKPILVDENGKILAMEMDLRGENLEKTLEKHLGK